MKLFFLKSALVLLPVQACPFAGTNQEKPNDHPATSNLRGRRLKSLDRSLLQKKRQEAAWSKARATTRNLNGGQCFTQDDYLDIVQQVEIIADSYTDITDKGHFYGGIVRLAAHDFMDFDHDATEKWGMDGCFDTTAPENNGLETIWCDGGDCPLKDLYDNDFPFMSRADFWVSAANAVIQITSKQWLDEETNVLHSNLVLPLRYGRTDNDDSCVGQAERLPGSQSLDCSEVQRTFVDQMGLTLRDATALIGAHTLGFGNTDFSGHNGMWMEDVNQTVVFDNEFYSEVLGRAWRVRGSLTDDPVQDWTWAGNNGGNPRFMLNTDLCLAIDFSNSEPNCCTLIRDGPNTIDGTIDPRVFCLQPPVDETLLDSVVECQALPSSDPKREAVEEFENRQGRNGNPDTQNTPFYKAFAEAWQKATELGYPEGTLFDLPVSDCSAPAPPTALPTTSPTLSPTEECVDFEGFFLRNPDRPNSLTDCAGIVAEDRCNGFGQSHCPVSCGLCNCIPRGEAGCTVDEDCCTNNCRNNNVCGR